MTKSQRSTFSGEIVQIIEPSARGKSVSWGVRLGSKSYRLLSSMKKARAGAMDLKQYNGHRVKLSGVRDDDAIRGVTIEGIKTVYEPETIRKIILIGDSDEIELRKGRGRIAFSGRLEHAAGGLYEFGDMVAAIGFSGSVRYPPGVSVQMHLGEEDLEASMRAVFGPDIEAPDPEARKVLRQKISDASTFMAALYSYMKSTGMDFFFGPDPAGDPRVIRHRQILAESERLLSSTVRPKSRSAGAMSTAGEIGRVLANSVALAPNLARPSKVKMQKGAYKALAMDRKSFKEHSEKRLEARRELDALDGAVTMVLREESKQLVDIARRSIKRHENNPGGNIPEAVLELFDMAEDPILSPMALHTALLPIVAGLIVLIAGCDKAREAAIYQQRPAEVKKTAEELTGKDKVEEDIDDMSDAAAAVAYYDNIMQTGKRIRKAKALEGIIEQVDRITRRAKGVKESPYPDTRKRREMKRYYDQMDAQRRKAGLPKRGERKLMAAGDRNDPFAMFRAGVFAVNIQTCAKALTDIAVRANTIGAKGRNDIEKRLDSIVDHYGKGTAAPKPSDSVW